MTILQRSFFGSRFLAFIEGFVFGVLVGAEATLEQGASSWYSFLVLKPCDQRSVVETPCKGQGN
jgi:hypothetical protein